MVIPGTKLDLFEADAFLDKDGDLRLRLTYVDKNISSQTVITTGKIKYEMPLQFSNGEESRIDLNVSIFPAESNKLFTMETYE